MTDSIDWKWIQNQLVRQWYEQQEAELRYNAKQKQKKIGR